MDVSSFLGGNFLTQVDLPQPYQVWTIGKVDQQLVGQGQTADEKICIAFNEFPSKPLACNKTNLKAIAGLYSTDANRWIGQLLLVYRSATEFQGKRTLCVRACGPQQAPADSICDPQGNAVLYQPQPAAPVAQPATQPIAPQPVQAAPAQPVAPVAAPQPVPQPVAPPAQPPVAAQPPVQQQPEQQQPEQQQPTQQAATPWEQQQQNNPPSA